MNKKIAQIFEWIGVGIILAGVTLFALIYLKVIDGQIIPHLYSILLFVLGFGILCYAPISIFRFYEYYDGSKKAEEENKPFEEIEQLKKAANSQKRSIALKIICSAVLIIYGVLKIVGLR